MKVIQINPVCGHGSTGRICIGIAELLRAQGHEAYIAYGLGQSEYLDSYNISDGRHDYLTHNILSRLSDSEGLHSIKATKRLINWIEAISPDIVHIHTLHGHYVNYKLLFEYLYKANMKVIMTLHDCWSFTGHCAHFDHLGCEKWKTGCGACKHLYEYPKSWGIDRSKRNYALKKKLITQFGDRLTIVPVSYWLENLVRQSFMKDMNIKTIHNGIDLTKFHPIYNESLTNKYGLQGKTVILGVALPWSGYKGLPDFYKLRLKLGDEYAIILVGLSQQQISDLPEGIIGIPPTDNVEQLVELYTIADVLVNTTYCDNYPTVNLEAISCGTPVITYKTGGSPEAIVNQFFGEVAEQGSIDQIIYSIQRLGKCSITQRSIRSGAARETFDQNVKFKEYIDLYLNMI